MGSSPAFSEAAILSTIAPKQRGFHNRALLRDLKATYTNPLKRYLSASGRDYVRNKLCLHASIAYRHQKMVEISYVYDLSYHRTLEKPMKKAVFGYFRSYFHTR